jgi:hypothetical protein
LLMNIFSSNVIKISLYSCGDPYPNKYEILEHKWYQSSFHLRVLFQGIEFVEKEKWLTINLA